MVLYRNYPLFYTKKQKSVIVLILLLSVFFTYIRFLGLFSVAYFGLRALSFSNQVKNALRFHTSTYSSRRSEVNDLSLLSQLKYNKVFNN